MTVVEMIQSGQFSAKEISRAFPEYTTAVLNKLCNQYDLRLHRKNYREAMMTLHKDTVRKMWVNNMTDRQICTATGFSRSYVKDVRMKFGYINDLSGDHDDRKKLITSLFNEGKTDAEIAEIVNSDLGDKMTVTAVRAFRTRENLTNRLVHNGCKVRLMEKFKPLFDTMTDLQIAKLTGVHRNTVYRYRKIDRKLAAS